MFVLQTIMFTRHHGLVILGGLLLAIAVAAVGIYNMIRLEHKFYYKLLPAVAYVLLTTGPFSELRASIMDRANMLRFYTHYNQYRKDIVTHAPSQYKEWKLGYQETAEFFVVYDVSWKFRKTLYNDGRCRSSFFSPEANYYIVTRACT